MRRFRQIVSAINRRNFLARREQISLLSWQTRQLASFIAAGYMVDGKKGNPALDAANVLAFDEIEEAQIEESVKRNADKPKVKGSVDDPAVGSFERFMGTMGNPFRWAGR